MVTENIVSFQLPVHPAGRSGPVVDSLSSPGQQTGRDDGEGCRRDQELAGEGDVSWGRLIPKDD